MNRNLHKVQIKVLAAINVITNNAKECSNYFWIVNMLSLRFEQIVESEYVNWVIIEYCNRESRKKNN